MFQIIRDLFINACILISAVSLSNTFSKRFLCPSKSVWDCLENSFLAGVLGCILMIFSVNITSTILIDFRLIPIIMMAIYCSPGSGVVAAIVISFFRIAYFGLNTASISAVIVAIVLALGCIPISRRKMEIKLKWVYCVLLLFVVFTIASVLMVNSSMLWCILMFYFMGIASISFGLYHLLGALLAANRAYANASQEAKTDFLTGISNYRDMQQSFQSALAAAEEKKESISILFLDVDDFKRVNDTYGHLEGDKVLKNVAHTLISVCKNTDIVSRRGGDEFTAVLIDCNLEKAKKVAERLRKSIEQYDYVTESGKKHKITVSIGLSSFPETATDEMMLIKQADNALYKAKSLGKNSFWYTPLL